MSTFGLVMIVRNEAANIERCLASARPYISYWTICDTGSRDDTIRRARAALRGIPGRLSRAPWVDFGHNRSEVLALARGTAEWLLCLDADMTVEIDSDFVPDPAIEAYMVEMGEPAGFSWRLPLLVRGDLPWRSIGKVHAYTNLSGRPYVRANTDAIRVHRADSSNPEKTRRQAEVLEAEYAANPNDPRTVFYLAQTLRELGRIKEARELYLRRATMGGFPEEAWYAAFRAALLAPDWPTEMNELLAAWNLRPQRLEPLCAVLRGLNERRVHRVAYALASVVSPPCTDVLFVHRSVWDWGMTLERSIAAWHVGQIDESRTLCDELLANPRLPALIRARVEKNRGLCEEAT